MFAFVTLQLPARAGRFRCTTRLRGAERPGFESCRALGRKQWSVCHVYANVCWLRRPGPWPGAEAVTWSRDYPIDSMTAYVPATPTLPEANLRYQEALLWRCTGKLE